MKKWWFNLMSYNSYNKELKHRCELNINRYINKLMYSLDPIEHTSESEDPIINDMNKSISSWPDSGSCNSSNSSNVERLFDIRSIWSLISDDTFLVRDNNGNSYSMYLDIENSILEIDNDTSFRNELEGSFSNYLNSNLNSNCLNSRSKSKNPYYSMYDTQSSWNNHINSCIDCYFHFEISIDSSISGGTENYNDNYIYNFICNESRSSSIRTGGNGNDPHADDLDPDADDFDADDLDADDFDTDDLDADDLDADDLDADDLDTDDLDADDLDADDLDADDFDTDDLNISQKYGHLWVQCENCYGLNYKKFFRSKMNICEECGYHLKMSSSDRIELLIDPGTWDPMNEDMVSTDPIEFHSEEEPYKDRINSYQRKTGLTEAVQTGIGQLNGIPLTLGVMDFQFMGGSMGSVVGEKITRLIEYATNQSLPLIIVCASGGARMQEGSLSLMQMAKISSVSYNYQLNKKLFYVSILTSPTTGGVTASFGMLGDVIIAEPNAYIAFAGKRVIEQTLNKTVPDGSQVAEHLFDKGLFDSIVPRNPLKGVLSELFQLHGFFPLNPNLRNEKE
uniref:acetyl-CoA carboxylase carboxyltransferase beta subunit n=1 Tax=Hydrocharis chevalieri TaxID=2884936 RepID=UPI001F12A1B3|nr:acetyl-CoA carboxylase carboxyltransferase beta subunit [Hydrocharis chevalieri]UKT61089.1 acetyl-CoA carboxylase carboxyltransferase beta subunit [Hydrocharis chevalieri]